ncbi:MAG: hypothetical protein KJ850_11840 [Gammaproteobacteria bacterium]|nr:hypothetical protein [Gammaproteobacteria bacterium]MBU1625723.1 hypothetical protein [Gammaproteobacteria bacterium]MBU1980983.1 hypothetical protein [Gammaproteobacteria bacterium]
MKLIALFGLLLLAGCADPAHNLYEGIKQSNDAKRTPMERATQPAPDYDSYRKSLENADAK